MRTYDHGHARTTLRQRRLAAGLLGGLVLLTGVVAVPVGATAAPPNDSSASPTALALGVAQEFDGTSATPSGSDPATCSGSHGAYAGPYYGSVWFSYKAAKNDRYL